MGVASSAVGDCISKIVQEINIDGIMGVPGYVMCPCGEWWRNQPKIQFYKNIYIGKNNQIQTFRNL